MLKLKKLKSSRRLHFLLLLLILLFNSCSKDVWFNDVVFSVHLSANEEKELVKYIAGKILNKNTGGKIPGKLRDDSAPKIIFITLADSNSTGKVFIGKSAGIENAIDDAISQIEKYEGLKFNSNMIKIDIVNEVFSVKLSSGSSVPFERSLYGLAFTEDLHAAFLPEEIMANTLINSSHEIVLSNIKKYQNRNKKDFDDIESHFENDSITVFSFSLRSFFYTDNEVYQLYRGHRQFDKIKIEDLQNSLSQAGNYLKRSVLNDGKFIYSYLPRADKISSDYNIIRHAGTIYSMMELYNFNKDEDLLNAAKKAIKYLIGNIREVEFDDNVYPVVVEDGYTKLGGNALTVVALSKYSEVTGDDQYLSLSQQIGRWIIKSQDNKGRFVNQKMTYPEKIIEDMESVYYPGEAILALNRLYALDKNAEWLQAAEKAAKYLIQIRDGDKTDEELPHDHWLLYALNELYRERKNKIYLNHSIRISNTIINSQNLDPEYPDWYGSYYKPPRSTPTAIRSEGLIAAYSLVKDFINNKSADEILAAVKRGIRFQLQTQFIPETSIYLQRADLAAGGFCKSLTDFEIRIDYVQHNISSILGCIKIISTGI